ncbi:uncharacterized protein I206_103730 [Kwoniella pini CBS 10737]|uniref:histidine kinase n=1 Tax=Kwoniella pini CBS 10737 TaxID=1296096 RepID=A0A1B9I8Z7_9TREE|nr:uncharacterized protein I206_01269 [Kwoniella pini CBS 10737]OCF51985.1 hypothetical protein I206_01269 [Kwoniella pini CBS 10737]
MSPLPVVDDLLDTGSEASIRLQEWTSFLQSYASGAWQSGSTPDMPQYVPEPESVTVDGKHCDVEKSSKSLALRSNVYSSPVINKSLAKRIRLYLSEHDYLPPPRSPQESLRDKIIQEYDLTGPVSAGNIQSAVEVIAAFFPGTIVTFSLYSSDMQNSFGEAGPQDLLESFGLKTGNWVEPESSMCGHSILLDGQILHVPSLEDDWRFRSNPYGQAGMKSYIGSPVSLEVDPLNSTPSTVGTPERVGIGVLNILFMYKPLKEMTAQHLMVVKNITKMLETQLRATWEGHTRTREAKVRRALTDLIDEAFVGDQSTLSDSFAEANQVSKGAVLTGRSVSALNDLAQSALDRLITLAPEIEAVVMMDIRGIGFKAAEKSSDARYFVDPTSLYPISSSAFASQHGISWNDLPGPSDLTSFLNQSQFGFTFSRSSPSALQPILPPQTQSHLVIPFFVLDQPSFIIIAISQASKIPSSTINITRSMGSILLAKAMQSRVMEADTAKTAFLSSISHELRTPMHSILSGLTLARSAIEDKEWENLNSLLGIVENSGHALNRILDDVLDFDPGFNKRTSVLRRIKVDLLKLSQKAIQMCLTKSDDLETGSTVHLEHEGRDWTAYIDEARFHRILINGITNAMKFCKKGSITISLTTANDSTSLIARVTDTGMGIDEKVLPRLLEPFTKQDLHSPGAGLGLYITKNLVNSMGGTFALRSSIGTGTVFEATLPIEFEFVNDNSNAGQHSVQHNKINEGAIAEKLPFTAVKLGSAPTVNGLTTVEEIDRSLKTTKKKKVHLDDLKVMVVDDNHICRMLLTRSIKKGATSVQCVQAADGAEAVKVFTTFRPDLVITDVSMPVMDGITAAQQMRSISEEMQFPSCKIYALTGLGSSDPRLQSIGMAGSAALDGWLVKGQDDLKAIQSIIAEVYKDVYTRRIGDLQTKVEEIYIDNGIPPNSLLMG